MQPTPFLRRAFLPPDFVEPLGESARRLIQRFRVFAILISIAIDIGIVLMLRDAPSVRPEVVTLFAWINIPLLLLDLALVPLLANKRLFPWINFLQVLIEGSATMVWLHLTGALTSYFVCAVLFFFAAYRFILDYRWGLVAIAVFYAAHLSLFVLHELGTIAPAPLFVTPPVELYADTAYRWVTWTSITSLYVGAFAVCNLIIHHMRSTEAELRRAEDDLLRVARGAAQGRLTHRSLDGGYQLGELLGRGGWGEVYLAKHLESGDTCAVKVLHPHLTDDRESLSRFEHEARAASKLPDQYVPRIRAISTTGPECYIAMEYLQGEDLRARIRRLGHMDAQQVARLVHELAAAVDAAHAAGVIHRDLKPSNIFLTGEEAAPVIKLLDFGISKLQDRDADLTMTSVLLGSPSFMSPEQARGAARSAGPAADLFSLGGITYFALSGRKPFPSGDRDSALAAVQSEPLAVLAGTGLGLHHDVDRVLAIAMAKNPEDRYGSAREFAVELAAAIDGELSENSRRRAASLNKDGPELTVTASR